MTVGQVLWDIYIYEYKSEINVPRLSRPYVNPLTWTCPRHFNSLSLVSDDKYQFGSDRNAHDQ